MDKKDIAIGVACGTVIMGVTVAMKKAIDKVVEKKAKEIIRQQQADDAEEMSFPERSRYITDEKKIEYISELKKLILGEKKFKDYKREAASFMECLLYEKLQRMPEDCHTNGETWFIAQNIGAFTKRMKEERPSVYERLMDMAHGYMVEDWVRYEIIQADGK